MITTYKFMYRYVYQTSYKYLSGPFLHRHSIPQPSTPSTTVTAFHHHHNSDAITIPLNTPLSSLQHNTPAAITMIEPSATTIHLQSSL